MSASIFYSFPTKSHNLPFNAKSDVITAMTKLFGNAPWILRKNQLGELRGLDAAVFEDGFKKIIKLIDEHEEIIIDYQY